MLNAENINALRQFPGRPADGVGRPHARAPDAPWRYVNVRRLVSYIEDSLIEGLRWAVFEPNNAALGRASSARSPSS